MGWLVDIWTWIKALDVAIWQALIAGLVVAIGWIVTGIQNRREARRQRKEKTRDFHKALYAEIRNSLAGFENGGTADEVVQGILERMGADPSFVPFIPKEIHDRVFRVVVEDIDVLPRQTIDLVVAYYSQVQALGALVEDMRSEVFAQLSQDRRILMYQHYWQMRISAFDFGESAIRVILAYSNGGKDAAEAELKALSTRAGAPGDQT